MIDKKELTIPKQQASKALSAAQALAINDNEGLVAGTNLLGKIKAAQKLITAKKQAITKPINEALREVRSLFATLENNISEAEGIVKNKMLVYEEAVSAVAEAKEAKLAMRVEKGTMRFDTAQAKIETIERVGTTRATNGGVQFRVRKVAVVTDISKLPLEYLVPDMVKINQAIKAGKTIPGVTIEERKEVAGYTAQTKENIIE